MKSLLLTSLLGLSAQVTAQLAAAPFGDITYAINIPQNTASTGQGDIFMQIKAPTRYAWVALGQGGGMVGSNIFVAYSSADGKNVTVSPRIATSYSSPNHNAAAQITVLEGSGIENGMMTANFKCSNCQSWSGGSMNFADDSADWVHAAYTGSPMDTDDVSVRISQHNAAHAPFPYQMSLGRGGDSVNPFVDPAQPAPAPAANAGSVTTTTSFPTEYIIAHGVLGSLAMVIFFPIGSISMRVLSFPGLIWFHAGIQMFSYLILTAAVGLGIYVAQKLTYLDRYHPIIGLVVFALMFFQPIGGILHHMGFKKTGGRTIWSHGHIWLGRALITLGMINGGLGLLLADNSRSGNIAYGVVAGVMFVVWVAASLYGELKREKEPVRFDSAPSNDVAGAERKDSNPSS